MGRRNLVVFDIDGVLMDSEHRLPHMLAGDFPKYFKMWQYDTPLPPGIAVCKMFIANPEYRVIFCTGRSDTLVHRIGTLTQLQNNISPKIRDSQLLMREYPEVGPHLHDTVKKPLMIEQAGYSLDNIFMVFEDRNSIVDMWRERGITVYHTQDGDF
jgi:phosphoglycolate phosphatase-like HAD superfamily hydrolase